MKRLALAAIALAAVTASQVNAVETVISGLVGTTTERPIGVPTLNGKGNTKDNCRLNKKNLTTITVNCVAETAVVYIVARGIPNASGAPAVFIQDDNVNACVSEGVVGFINEVCGTMFYDFDIDAAISQSVAFYSYPINGKSTVTVTAVITAPKYLAQK